MQKLLFLFLLSIPSFLLGQNIDTEINAYRTAQKESFLKDEFGPLRKENVQYLSYYPSSSDYIVEADVELLQAEKTFRMPTYDGTSNPYKRYAILTFKIGGTDYQLTAYQSASLFGNPAYANYLFLPFLDQTNGEDTYGGGRYIELDATQIMNGKIKIDFNKAYNPYCAYSSGYRCPQPPSENSLAIAILAGEKKYKGPKNERPVNKNMAKNFNEKEKKIILSGDKESKLHVYQITDEKELNVLKSSSTDINSDDPLIPILKQRMLLTVQDPSHPGVGIAAPQVGINKNLIWVQRFDKEGEPFEFYINPKIIWRSKLIRTGAEGCLSIPDQKENVERNNTIRLQYWDEKGNIIEENIEGFTAVIFQHEVDHLYGILYPDRVEEQQNRETIELNEKIKYTIEKGVTLIP
ncbi:peptide deformylase [Sphingobacterium rhinopitheci]|uniref:peptide deformylase n=1 Tax=Sphingobacterium rhinopitheci TaxID=2781960 RepID=UPI001F5232C7|nr:peptide deformylase [Sphingobacterium rhinopitheci]MCI0920617.1 peptide deformylase [Sphingobacterium rhinopitheci]